MTETAKKCGYGYDWIWILVIVIIILFLIGPCKFGY